MLATLIACSFSASSRAQEAPEDDPPAALRRSPAWALLFQIDRRFTLRRFDGLLVALERSRSAGSALRLGISFEGSSLDRDIGHEFEAADRRRFDDAQHQFDGTSTWVNLLYVAYSNPGGRLQAYWACGPQAGLMRQDDKSSYRDSMEDRTVVAARSSRGTEWSAGIGGAFGVRWYPARSFGLLAEYKASASVYFVKATRTESSTGSPASSSEFRARGFVLRPSRTTFGLAVRF